jgi:hypothetical protein
MLIGTRPASAQGFGPDPFRPYNSQYDAYTYAQGQFNGEPAYARVGNRNANQFQDFLNNLQAPVRGQAGTPYFRSSVDLSSSAKLRESREYRPNRQADMSFEETQQRLSEKYFAFSAERDPKKRAQLLRDYTVARRQSQRNLAVRRENPERTQGSAPRPDSVARSGGSSGPRAPQPLGDSVMPRAGRMGDDDSTGAARRTPDAPRASASRSMPPPPALPFDRSGTRPSARRPSDVLDRVPRVLDSRPGDSTGTNAARSRRPPPALPGLDTDAPK